MIFQADESAEWWVAGPRYVLDRLTFKLTIYNAQHDDAGIFICEPKLEEPREKSEEKTAANFQELRSPAFLTEAVALSVIGESLPVFKFNKTLAAFKPLFSLSCHSQYRN